MDTEKAGQNQDLDFHSRLLNGDPTAPSDLCGHFLPALVPYLAKAYPSMQSNPDLILEAAVDTLLAYCQHPDKFDPSRRSLDGYLKMAALGDLRNLAQKEKRRNSKIVPLETVEHQSVGGNNSLEDQIIDRLELQNRLKNLQLDQTMVELSERDRQVLALLQAGERRTEDFALILEINHLPFEEQKRLVKQHKDRLKAKLKRRNKKQADYGTR